MWLYRLPAGALCKLKSHGVLCSFVTQYWNWFSKPADILNSPLFDGSDTSLSGDGAFFAHNGSLVGSKTVWLPSGNGGGCLLDGPFKEYVNSFSNV